MSIKDFLSTFLFNKKTEKPSDANKTLENVWANEKFKTRQQIPEDIELPYEKLTRLAKEVYAKGMSGKEWAARVDEKTGTLTTYCNFAVRYFAAQFNYDGFTGLMANDMVKKMQASKEWVVVPPKEAQNAANRGEWVVAGWSNPNGHGHVATVIPGRVMYSPSWQDEAPMVINIGKDTFINKSAAWAFSADKKPQFFLYVPSMNKSNS